MRVPAPTDRGNKVILIFCKLNNRLVISNENN